MNMKTIKNLITATALSIIILGANSVNAYVPGVWDPQPRVVTNETGFTKVPMPIDAPVLPQTTPNPTYKAIEAAPISTVAITPVKKTTTVATNTNTRPVTRVNTTSNTNYPVQNFDQNNTGYPYNTYNNTGNGLTALSVAGSNSFMPDTVIEWIFVILLILAIIVIIRRITRPASHDVHVVTGH
jgi:ATP-dependent Zn protease